MPTTQVAPRKKYDWLKLKAEYLSGEWMTVRSFLIDKGIPITNFKQVSGWSSEKEALKRKALEKSAQKTLEHEIGDISETRARQARLARFLQLKGAEKLKTATDKDMNVDDARKLVITGMQEERKALGMEGGAAQNLTQININAGPKTNLDKMVDKLDYEGILGLIAELKRERARRTVQQIADNSAGEAQDGEVV